MEENKLNPSDINSLQVISVLKKIKKRKLQAEQLGLPITKHKCWDQAVASDEPTSILYGGKSIDRHITKGKAKVLTMEAGSEPESMKDSNSYTQSSDSSTSIYGEAKMEVEYAKTYDQPYSSSVSYSSENTGSQGDGLNVKKANCSEGAGLPAFLNLEEQLLEFGNHEDCIASEYGADSLEQYTETELEDILHAKELNPNVYVLSSGRWTVNQEDQSGSRKPTIDQEFERYFSMLML